MGTKSPPRIGDLGAPQCPSREILDHLTSRWAALVLIMLRERTWRFGELRDRIGGVSDKMLAQTLRTLEDDGFVDRRVFPEIPPRVEYSLTAMGREVAALVHALGDWVERNAGRVKTAQGRRRSARERAARG